MSNDKKTIKLTKKIKLPAADFVMPIAGYGAPRHSFEGTGGITLDCLIDRAFKMIKDAGINLINCSNVDYKENANECQEIINLANSYDMGVLISDSRITADMSEQELADCLEAYAAERAFRGLCVSDSKVLARLNSYENIFAYCNILPLEVGADVESYECYVRDFCENANPKVLAYNNLLYSNVYDGKFTSDEAYKNFFLNLSVVSKCSVEYGIPFWCFIQAGGNFENGEKDVYKYYPSDSEFLWMVNVYLAHGAKGVQYFPLVQDLFTAKREDRSIDLDRSGIIGADTLPTAYWSYTRSTNVQVADVATMLMQCKCEAIIATGEAANMTKGIDGFLDTDSFRQLVSVESGKAGAIIGCFDYKKRTAFYVVNNDLDRRREITLNFNSKQTLVVLQTGDKRTEQNAETLKLSLSAGAGALVFLWTHLGD